MLDPASLLEEDPPEETPDTVRDVPSETFWAFVVAFLSAQTGLASTSLGVLLIWFRGQWTVGSVLVAVGALALGLTVGVYLWHRSVRER